MTKIINKNLKRIIGEIITRPCQRETDEIVRDIMEALLIKPLLTTAEVEHLYNLDRSFLSFMRVGTSGPNYFKLGSHRGSRVFYRVADMEAWLRKHYVGHSEAASQNHESLSEEDIKTKLKQNIARVIADPRERSPDEVAQEIMSTLLVDPLWTTEELESAFNLSRFFLTKLRTAEAGPNYFKLGTYRNSRVFYRVADVEAWLKANYHEPKKPASFSYKARGA